MDADDETPEWLIAEIKARCPEWPDYEVLRLEGGHRAASRVGDIVFVTDPKPSPETAFETLLAGMRTMRKRGVGRARPIRRASRRSPLRPLIRDRLLYGPMAVLLVITDLVRRAFTRQKGGD